jgi:hypothetical protein
MRLPRPDADTIFVNTLLAAAAVVAVWLIYLAVDGARHLWLAGQYPANSVCARQHDARAHLDLVMLDAGTAKPGATQAEREKQQEKAGQDIAEAENSGAEHFFAVLELAEKAKATGIARAGTLCLPEKLAVERDAVFTAYATDLASRIKAHPETCNADADADAMAWIIARFPCGTATPMHP